MAISRLSRYFGEAALNSCMSCITEKTEDKTEKQGRSVFLITGRTLTLLTALKHLQRIHYNTITLIKLRLASLQSTVPKIPFFVRNRVRVGGY